MAINKTKKSDVEKLPATLDDLLQKSFTDQYLESHYKAQYKDSKAEVLEYLNSNEDDFNIDKGVGLKTRFGSVTFSGRERISMNTDVLAELIESGKITIHQVLACLSSDAFKMDETRATFSGEFSKAYTISETEGLTFRANSEFKESCAANVGEFKVHEKKAEPKHKLEEIKSAKPELEVKPKKKSLSSIEKAKAARALISRADSAEDDLDAILKGK